jgi:hypothetical protein
MSELRDLMQRLLHESADKEATFRDFLRSAYDISAGEIGEIRASDIVLEEFLDEG